MAVEFPIDSSKIHQKWIFDTKFLHVPEKYIHYFIHEREFDSTLLYCINIWPVRIGTNQVFGMFTYNNSWLWFPIHWCGFITLLRNTIKHVQIKQWNMWKPVFANKQIIGICYSLFQSFHPFQYNNNCWYSFFTLVYFVRFFFLFSFSQQFYKK